jgi:DUF1680 family protein
MRSEGIRNKLEPPQSSRLSERGDIGARFHVNAARRLLQIDEAALLTPFRVRAKDTTFDRAWLGEHVGKFLDAACSTLAHHNCSRLHAKVERCVTGLLATQGDDGYLGTYPLARRWTAWDIWVHKYCLIGLMSYHRITCSTAALTACERAADLLTNTFGDTAGKRPLGAIGMHMGMASTSILEPMCALYERTRNSRYLEFCEYVVRSFEEPGGSRLISDLLDHGEVHRTANGKAYEMLSNLVGILDLYRLTGSNRLWRAVTRAYADIVAHQLYPTGSMSAGEHFQPPGRLLCHQSSNICETCVTVTWLQLNQSLFRLTGEARYGCEIERTVFNHLFAAQDPDTGAFCYYTSLLGKKEFSNALLCCVSSGSRAIARLPELIFASGDKEIVINLLASGVGVFTLDNVTVDVAINTDYPRTGDASVRIAAGAPTQFKLRIRKPEGAGRFSAKCEDGASATLKGDWLEFERVWPETSAIRIDMELPLRTFTISENGTRNTGFQRGPCVLAVDVSENPHLDALHRLAFCDESPFPEGARATRDDATEIACEIGGRLASGDYRYRPGRIILAPFARVRDYRIGLPTVKASAPLSLTAFQRCAASHERPGSYRQAPTDEDQSTFLLAHASDASVAQLVGFEPIRPSDVVWFAAEVTKPHRVSRIVFRHASADADEGVFDTSRGMPIVEIASFPLGVFYDFLPDFYRAAWTKAGELAVLPQPTAVITRAHAATYELRLAEPRPAFAIRVVGKCSGDYVSCAELSAYCDT